MPGIPATQDLELPGFRGHIHGTADLVYDPQLLVWRLPVRRRRPDPVIRPRPCVVPKHQRGPRWEVCCAVTGQRFWSFNRLNYDDALTETARLVRGAGGRMEDVALGQVGND